MSPVRDLMGFSSLVIRSRVTLLANAAVHTHSSFPIRQNPEGCINESVTHADSILSIEDRNLVFIQQALPDQFHSFLQRWIFFDVLEKVSCTLLTV